MSDFYTRIAATTDKMLERFGGPATLSRVTKAYDKALDETVETSVDVPCTAVVKPRHLVSDSGVVVVQTVATLNAKPQIGDRFTHGANSYRVESVEEISPTGAASYRPEGGIAALAYKAVLSE